MSRTRRMFTSTQKAEIVRRHLQDQVPVSELAAELDVQPSQIHQWVQAALAQIERAFEKTWQETLKRSAAKLEQPTVRKIYELEQKLQPQKRGHCRTHGGKRQGKKAQWGPLKGRWVPHDHPRHNRR